GTAVRAADQGVRPAWRATVHQDRDPEDEQRQPDADAEEPHDDRVWDQDDGPGDVPDDRDPPEPIDRLALVELDPDRILPAGHRGDRGNHPSSLRFVHAAPHPAAPPSPPRAVTAAAYRSATPCRPTLEFGDVDERPPACPDRDRRRRRAHAAR